MFLKGGGFLVSALYAVITHLFYPRTA